MVRRSIWTYSNESFIVLPARRNWESNEHPLVVTTTMIINISTFLLCRNCNYVAGSTVTNSIECHNSEVVGHTRVESSDYNHFNCTVDDLHTMARIKEGRLLVHDSVSHDGGIVIVGFLPHQADAVRGGVS